MVIIPICKIDKVELHFSGFASMGGSHSNYYKCGSCGREVIIYDSDLEMNKTIVQDGIKYAPVSGKKEF